jgi:serine/threonine protein kinase
MAQVYLAEDANEKRLVAVKVLYPQFGDDLSYVQRFKREAKLASSLTSPHIVRVLDYGADRDVYYLIMEYIAGRDLRDTLDQVGQFTWRDALETLDQLAAALEHASGFGIVHRDIKPQNLMLDETGLLKVLDFGIARVDALPSLTQSGFVGSPYYVSPEQAMGEAVDVRSDIYSSGVVLYELLSGKIPFDAKSPWSVISKHISSEPPPIDFSEDDVPEDVQQLLARMVAKRPDDRFQTPTELRQAISTILAGHPMPECEISPDDPTTADVREIIVDSFYQRALKAAEIGEWGRATSLLYETIKLDPDHADAIEKLVETEQEAQLLENYNAAKQAIKNGFWYDALNRLNSIINVRPNYRDVQDLRPKAEEGTKKDTAKKLISAYQEDSAEANKQSINQQTPYTTTSSKQGRNMWLWVAMGAIIISIIAAGILFTNNQGNAPQQDLKVLYQEAKQALDAGDEAKALALLEQISVSDPNYADVSTLMRELKTTPTVPPTETVVQNDPLAEILEKAQGALNLGHWSDVLDMLGQIKAENSDYETTLVSTMFCDAYVNRGLETLNNLDSTESNQTEFVETALHDFEAGAKECPIRTDLREQANRATSYLEALNTPADDFDTLIQVLTPIVSAQPDYGSGKAKDMLYNAHLARGDSWREQGEMVRALTDYEAALALGVPDPIEASTRQKELLTGGRQPTPSPTVPPTQAPVSDSTASPIQDTTPTPTPEPTATPMAVTTFYEAPKLITENDSFYAGKLTEVRLVWEPVKELADDEYYDLTITHIFGDEIVYWGHATQETELLLSPDIGVGKAGSDRFNWWVTVRKKGTAPDGGLDMAVSEQSEIRTFIWEG